MHVLRCTAYRNLTNTFLISSPSKTAIYRRCLRLRPSEQYIVCQDLFCHASFNLFVNINVQTESVQCAGILVLGNRLKQLFSYFPYSIICVMEADSNRGLQMSTDKFIRTAE